MGYDTTLSTKVTQDIASQISILAKKNGVTNSTLLRDFVVKLLDEAKRTPEDQEIVDRANRQLERDKRMGDPVEDYSGTMFIDKVRKIVGDCKVKLRSQGYPLDGDDYDHLIGLVTKNVKVSETFPESEFIQKWLRRLIKELEEEKAEPKEKLPEWPPK